VQSFGQNIGQQINGGAITHLNGDVGSVGFDDFAADVRATGMNVGVGFVAGEIASEILSGVAMNQQWCLLARINQNCCQDNPTEIRTIG